MPAESIELLRLVERITYGSNRQFVAIAESLDYEAFLDWQLAPDDIDDGGLEEALLDFLPTLSMDATELGDFIFEQQNFGAAQRDLILATMIRQIYSPRQLLERVVEFWSDHFNVPMNSVVTGYFKVLEDRSVIRPLALGRFEDLLVADAKSPAMLYYLDNFSSTADGPNENYARELLELHTLGVGGGYTEDDIKETARVFTGWTIRRPADFFFQPLMHDYGSKQVLGEEIAPEGLAEGEALLARIAGMEATARHLATKLARRFVADLPEPEVVEAVADAYLQSAGDLRTTLKTLLMHPRVRATMALKLKRPNEFSTAALRGLEVDLGAQVLTHHYEALLAAGHLPFSWPAPNGYPDQRAYWQSSNGFLMRFNQAAALSNDLLAQSPVLREAANVIGLDDQIEILEGALRPQGLDSEERRRLKRYCRLFRQPADQRAAALAGWILGSPQSQWR
ncbi:MAG: DUF1800 domain-containing protein [Wenzhouxiangella sp.]|jgi:uncharacterized protein (DUF1800 family)|nr:DUF1800 domain-containing protein [Wenzhouxiangella sp.]